MGYNPGSGFPYVYPPNQSDVPFDDPYGQMGGANVSRGWDGPRQDSNAYVESDEDDEKDLEYVEAMARYQVS